MQCIEMNARENPLTTCVDLMNEKSTHFAMLSAAQKEQICASVATDSEGKSDVCGFIIVSAYQVYSDFYKALEAEMGEWILAKLDGDLNSVKEDGYSEGGSTSAQTIVDTADIEKIESIVVVLEEPETPAAEETEAPAEPEAEAEPAAEEAPEEAEAATEPEPVVATQVGSMDLAAGLQAQMQLNNELMGLLVQNM